MKKIYLSFYAKRKLLALLLLSFLGNELSAQFKVVGKMTSAGAPLIGVNIDKIIIGLLR